MSPSPSGTAEGRSEREGGLEHGDDDKAGRRRHGCRLNANHLSIGSSGPLLSTLDLEAGWIIANVGMSGVLTSKTQVRRKAERAEYPLFAGWRTHED